MQQLAADELAVADAVAAIGAHRRRRRTVSRAAGTPNRSAATPTRIARTCAAALRIAVPLSCIEWLPAV